MARNGAIAAVVLVVLAAAMVVDAAERNKNIANCLRDCSLECKQIKIFNNEECNEECLLSCAGLSIRKTLREDDTRFFPSWI